MEQRDKGKLERALERHSINGYPVHVPILGDGTIQGIHSLKRGQIYYRVRPDEPIPFEDYAHSLRLDTTQLSLNNFVEYLRQEGRENPMAMLPPEIQNNLEAGGTASWKDIKEVWLMRGGCLDENRNVICEDFDSQHVTMPVHKLRKGMLVEFHDQKMKASFVGRIVGIEGRGSDLVVLIETFEPIPFMDAPEAMAPELIRPGFYSEYTWKLGYGTYEAFQKAGIKIPAGKDQKDPEAKRIIPHYILAEPVPLSWVADFCKENFPNDPICIWQSVILYIIPIHPAPLKEQHDGGYFTPLPPDVVKAGEIQVWNVEEFTGE